LPKTAENSGFYNTFEKAPPLTWQKAGLEAVLFCFLRASGGLSYRAFVATIVKQ
jgi:hypothetical protein